jgi:putative tricarboxylic transport membrane protein
MRIVFLVALLGGAVFYSYVAFIDLSFFNQRGRPGAGFFPRIVGVAMVVLVLWAMVDALRDRRAAAANGFHDGLGDTGSGWQDAAKLVLLALTYAVLLRIFGGFVSTIIYLGLALSVLNPGRHLQNALVAVIMPIVVYLLFDRLLNASMPPALIDLPF